LSNATKNVLLFYFACTTHDLTLINLL